MATSHLDSWMRSLFSETRKKKIISKIDTPVLIVVEKVVVVVEKKGYTLYDSLKVSDKRVPRKVRDNCKDPKDHQR